MATTVSVLCLNGRKQNIKVTANTSILEILEEVCKKQGFEASEHDLKHHKKVLDVTSTVRFSALPNNCLLEMTERSSPRTESNVTVAVQLESGQRVTRDFQPSQSLWEVVGENVTGDLQPVCIYMRNEVVGENTLRNTSLRSLGLTSGKAIIRFVMRSSESLTTQAHTGNMILTRPKSDLNNSTSGQRSSDQSTVASSSSQSSRSTGQPVSQSAKTCANQSAENSATIQPVVVVPSVESEPMDTSENTNQVSTKADETVAVNPRLPSASHSTSAPSPPEFKVITIEEGRTLLFHKDDITVDNQDLPDDFFDHTIEDIRFLMSDLKRKRTELENTPLQTSAMKEAERARKERQMDQCMLRVQFPDRLVLQSVYKPSDTLSTVASHVSGFLHDRSALFYLYLTPPKNILDPSITLKEANLVPSAVVHFGTHHPQAQYLNQSLVDQLNFAPARSLPNQIGVTTPALVNHVTEGGEAAGSSRPMRDELPTSEANQGEPSTSQQSQPSCSKTNEKKGAVPKWFKLGTK